ncbi:HET-domain-containing protein [Annulohypoxylon truncatum]|uniref:HET-domain-containing protein n=1 Tax=Annulohypoxylon truncatum TaxID=327061 RepID=UPI0020074066|nr:HET-domain-containing protein [Annulohypoxylon truncatum]KAI1214963.1 HET-domain-containing protein [Annulohypoxylon truncatum]
MAHYSHGIHCPLDNPSKEIRVLEIIDNSHETIECRLVKDQVDGEPYSALSWCWGRRDHDDKTVVHIIQSNEPYEFLIPRSLVSAMRVLRTHRIFRVWIDFVCMDQDNINEKNFQVPLMSSIYGEAECVYVWLGDEGENSKLAMEFVKNRVLNLKEWDRLIRDDKIVKEWQALSALMRRPWFSRRWIVQEIAIAQKATLFCGMDSVDWKDFADAVSLFNEVETGTRRISEVINDKVLGHMPDLGDISELSATKLVEETNNLFRRLSGNERQAQFSLEYLVSKLTTFDSSEPRDTIYALLAVARDTEPVRLLTEDVIEKWTWRKYIKQKLVKQLAIANVSNPYPVDYRLPLSDVYVQFVDWAIKKSDKTRALDIICRPWAPEPTPSDNLSICSEEEDAHWRIRTNSARPEGEGEDTLPSWIPTVARAAFGMDGEGQKMRRKNADSLVGLPPKRVYSAAGTRVLTENFRIEDGVTQFSRDPALNGLHYHSLFVEGFVLDKVRELKYPSQQGNIPRDWIRLARRGGRGRGGGPDDSNNSDLPDEFWRTLVADRGPGGENAPRYYPRLVRHALNQGVRGDSLNTTDIVNWGNCSIVGEVLRRVQSAIWNRRVMRTERDRSLGLAPEDTRPGDLVCVLYGCSVPVLLRPFAKTEREVAEEERQREDRQRRREREAAAKISQVWRDLVKIRRAAAERRRAGKPGSEAWDIKLESGTVTPEKESPRERREPGSQAPVPKAEKVPLRSDPYTYYQLIGECYVDGMMNGEALLQFEPSRLFEIR